MTVGQLNQICCEFAGIPATNTSTSESGEKFWWYPPVSTDWGAAGQLIDALQAKGIWLRLNGRNPGTGNPPIAIVCYIGGIQCRSIADHPARAICLAVAELAALSKERAA